MANAGAGNADKKARLAHVQRGGETGRNRRTSPEGGGQAAAAFGRAQYLKCYIPGPHENRAATHERSEARPSPLLRPSGSSTGPLPLAAVVDGVRAAERRPARARCRARTPCRLRRGSTARRISSAIFSSTLALPPRGRPACTGIRHPSRRRWPRSLADAGRGRRRRSGSGFRGRGTWGWRCHRR